jgi:hypothetical protein
MKPDLRTSGLQNYRIETVYAAIVTGEDGSEGVPAFMDPDNNVLMPAIFTDTAKLDFYKHHLARMAANTPGINVSIRTYKLAHEEPLEAVVPTDEEKRKKGEEYVAQITEMAKRGRKWIKAHPEAVPQVQFNFPQEMTVITDLTKAREIGAIVFNGPGKKLVNAMCDGMIGQRNEPTPFMLKMALELATSEQDEFEGEK